MGDQDATDTPDLGEVQTTLQKLFPSAPITQDIAQQVTNAITSGGDATPAGNAGGFRYYMAQATHTRTIGTKSQFVGNLPLVRAPLPSTGDFKQKLVPTIQTGIGVLLPEDRLIASVGMVADLFGTSQPVERVDVITPARAPDVGGARFGAFATYLCYTKATDTAPSWYVLEGGTAPGVPKVLYPSKGMEWIVNNQLDYTPTTFSKATDYVSGLLTMNGDEPVRLQIQVTDTSGKGPDTSATDPYVKVNVQYLKLDGPSDNYPLGLILEAAARIGVIGHAIGEDGGFSEDVIALFDASNLEWLVKPGTQ